MKKCLVVCDVTGNGGVPLYLSQLYHVASEADWRITFLIDNGVKSDPVADFLTKKNIPATRLPLRTDSNSEFDIKLAYSQYLKTVNPDVVHAVLGSTRSLLLPREITIENDIPLVFTEQYISEDLIFVDGALPRIRNIYDSASAVIFVCLENKQLAERAFGLKSKNAKVIANSVDFPEPDNDEFKKDYSVLTVSRLTHQKGIDILIDAIAVLKNERMMFTIAGDGDLSNELKNKAQSLLINEDKIKFLGWVDDPKKLYSEHELFVLPSRSEGLPFALMEALANSIPCIATSVSGIPEALNYGDFGCLIPNEDSDKLALEIKKHFQEPRVLREKAKLGNAFYRSNLTHEMIRGQIATVWNEACI